MSTVPDPNDDISGRGMRKMWKQTLAEVDPEQRLYYRIAMRGMVTAVVIMIIAASCSVGRIAAAVN